MTAVADARAHGETIVMTNGCLIFCIPADVQYLQQAKALGKRLIVAVNTNDSVSRLKGPARPINDLADRMGVLAALRAVDWVVPFNEDTPARLIKRVLPDVLVKGGDYRIEDIAGSDVVLANGGKVKTLDFRQGFSTTQIIQKMKIKETRCSPVS